MRNQFGVNIDFIPHKNQASLIAIGMEAKIRIEKVERKILQLIAQQPLPIEVE